MNTPVTDGGVDSPKQTGEREGARGQGAHLAITDEEMWIIPVTTKEAEVEYLVIIDSRRESARERALNWVKTQPNLVDLGKPKIPLHVL